MAFLGLLFAFWWFWGPGVGWRYVRPYRSLVARHATERQVLRETGKPSAVYRSRAEFQRALRDFSGPKTAKLWSGGPVLMQYADPWGDGEGLVVYTAFDAKGRAVATELVGHPSR